MEGLGQSIHEHLCNSDFIAGQCNDLQRLNLKEFLMRFKSEFLIKLSSILQWEDEYFWEFLTVTGYKHILLRCSFLKKRHYWYMYILLVVCLAEMITLSIKLSQTESLIICFSEMFHVDYYLC